MSKDFDVIVLGVGAAGAAAALAAAQKGARVCVVTGPPGATALFSGAWRGRNPEGFARALADAGYALHPCERPLPHPNGSVVTCTGATITHTEAQLGEPALIIGIAGLPGFHAHTLAGLWSARTAVPLAAATILVDATPAAGWSCASLAAHIHRDAGRLLRPLAIATAAHAGARIILPAVLGTDHDAVFHARLQEQLGCAVGEALAVAPSLPGWRLSRAISRALTNAGVSVVDGRAVASASTQRRVTSVTLTSGATLGARAFVLATGKYASGGIDAGSEFREPVFDCPVWVEHLGEAFDSVDPLILSDPVYSEDQPILRAGVHTDAADRPVNRTGDVVYENLFVAGSIRADWDNSTQGLGDAAASGWTAGIRATA